MSMTKHSCKLMFYKYFSVDEMYAAIEMLNWFADEAMSGKSKFDDKNKKWVIDPNLQLPSWKHLTRGGHENGMNIQRGAIGCYLNRVKADKSVSKNLIFRRHSKDKRIFVVQRKEDLVFGELRNDLKFKVDRGECVCKHCVGDVIVKSKLTMDDLTLYKEL